MQDLPGRYANSLIHFGLTCDPHLPVLSHTCMVGHTAIIHITALWNVNKTAGAWSKSLILLPIQQSLHNWMPALAADDAGIWTVTDCISTQRKHQIRGVKHSPHSDLILFQVRRPAFFSVNNFFRHRAQRLIKFVVPGPWCMTHVSREVTVNKRVSSLEI